MNDTINDPTTDPHAYWRNWRDNSRRMRDDRVSLWTKNADKRKAGIGDTNSEQVHVNKDWPKTKAKEANLYSQTPEVRCSAEIPELANDVSRLAKELNKTIKKSNVGATVGECLADGINASGIAGCIVSCEKLTAPTQIPKFTDPVIQMMSGDPMLDTVKTTDIAYPAPRISPADLLIDSSFLGSDYDQCCAIGRDGRMTWPQAQRAFGLTEEQKEKVVSGDNRITLNNTLNSDSGKFRNQPVVNFSEIFYWRHYFHPEETSFYAIQRLVFVDGIDDPVINEEYAGQKRMPDGSIVGMTKFPIRILTLTYVSDEALPPSDSTIARAAVNELEQIKNISIQQRKHSIPIRWADSNRISGNTKSLIEKGTFQGIVFTQGPGDRALGEVSRAAFPPENMEFEDRAERQIDEIYQTGSNQSGREMQGDKSATEARVIQQNFQTRVGQERDKVAAFFVGIAECIAGLMVLHGEYGLPVEIAGQVTYSVRTDAAVRLDVEARKQNIREAINQFAQSGLLNAKPLIEEYIELLGFDPMNHRGQPVVIDPQPKPPEPVNLSLKGEDLINPMALAHLSRTLQLPTPDDVSAVSKLLEAVGLIPGAASLMAPPVEPGGENGPTQDPQTPGISNPEWSEAPRINKRDEDGGA